MIFPESNNLKKFILLKNNCTKMFILFKKLSKMQYCQESKKEVRVQGVGSGRDAMIEKGEVKMQGSVSIFFIFFY